MNSQSPAQHHTPLTTSIVRKAGIRPHSRDKLIAVTTVRNADASVRARIHFAEDPENPYLQDLINGTQATAVTWDIQGLTPHGLVKLHLQYVPSLLQTLSFKKVAEYHSRRHSQDRFPEEPTCDGLCRGLWR